MCYGISGSSSLKSKADALKYAIEFTATGEYPNRVPDMVKAKELFDFICENVQLPETFDDGLSSFFQRVTETIEEEKRNKEKLEKPSGDIQITAEDTRISLANPERIFCDFQKRLAESDFEARGEFYSDGGYKHIYVDVGGPVRYRVTLEKEVTDSAREAVDTVEGIVEGEKPVKEEEPHPSSSALWNLYECIVAHTMAVGLKPHMGHGGGGEVEDVFRLDGYGEYLQVTLKHSIAPKPEKE